MLIFGIGGGVSFYEGIQHMRRPEPLQDPTWNYVVLGAAAVFEGASFGIALKQFMAGRGPGGGWESLRASKDPTTYTVLAEDGAALLGLVWASHRWNRPALDGAASVVIGLLLAAVAVAQAAVQAVGQPLSMYIGRQEVLLTPGGEFSGVPVASIASPLAGFTGPRRSAIGAPRCPPVAVPLAPPMKAQTTTTPSLCPLRPPR